jgi:CheY-like chemotaxis protein
VLGDPGESLRIILAEDDDEMRAWLRIVLRPLQARLVEASSGWELLELLSERGPFQLVITDVRMPPPSGLNVVTMARSAGLETPFLVITAFPGPELARSVARVGGATLLPTPFGASELLTAARALLDPVPAGVVG